MGRQVCQDFAKKGAHVLFTFRKDENAARKTLESLEGSGHNFKKCDVGIPQNITELFEYVQHIFGHIDIVVNNAGIGFHHPIDKCDFDQWQKGWHDILNVNLVGPSNVCYHAAQMMIPFNSGKIINVSSRGAFRGEPDQPAYGSSKAGLNSMTQSLAYSLAPYGIFVGAVAPGFIETDMAHKRLQGSQGDQIRSQSPMNRVGSPEEVSNAILLMASSNQWMTGSIFDVNGASYFRM